MAENKASEKREGLESGNRYDAIVIGTGMGGSACGALLAKHGFKVLILEKNPRIGGSCSYYEKDGFKIDMGTHMFIRGNKGPFGTCTRRLGMGTPLEFIRTRNIAWLRGFNVDARVPSNVFLMPIFIGRVLVQSGFPLRLIPNVMRMFYDILKMPPEKIEEWDGRTIEEFMAQYTEEPFVHALIGFLLGLYFILPPWQASAGESIWNFQRFVYDSSLGYPKGGAVAIPATFLKGAEMHGAKVMTNAGVTKIMVEDGKVAGVVVKDKDKFYAPVVVSTTSLRDTVFKLAGSQYFPKSYVNRVEKIKSSFIAVQAKIGLKKKVTDVGCVCGSYPRKRSQKDISLEEMKKIFKNLEEGKLLSYTPIYCPIPSNFDPDLAPPGRQLLTACAVAPTTDIELQDDPKAWIDDMLTALYDLVPGAKENAIFVDTFSVEAIANWIGKTSGAAVTTGQTPDQVGVNRPGHRTPVSGLYICGDGAGSRGVGTELACQSGMDCADLIFNDWRNYLI